MKPSGEMSPERSDSALAHLRPYSCIAFLSALKILTFFR